MRKTLFILINLVLCASFALAEEMPEGYYDDVNGTKDAELKGTLKSIIRAHTAIPYGSGSNSSWEVFYYSDQNEEGYCMDMYCDDWKKFGAPGSVVSGCNIEHSFAKSWWGGSENDAYKDCYHLNPSNSTANSARSNYPLGVPVKDFKSNSGSLKVGKMHHPTLDVDFWVFEPKDEYKGDFARAYFYMATCYGKDINGNIDNVCSKYNGWRLDNNDVGSKFAMQNDNYLEFQPWEQEVLITWHRQDPVSEKEIKRADAVSNFQHNRNPFIDYPFLAEYIWGEYAGEEVNMAQLMASFEDEFVPGISNGWRDGGSVTPTPKKKYGVTWSVNGEELRVDSIIENKKVTALPDAPTSCSAESKVFMGWTTATIAGSQDEAPEVLYTAAKDIPAITADITLYAVFARQQTIDNGSVAVETTFSFTKTVSSVTQDGVTVAFDQATGSNPPKYYDNGSAIRCYPKNTITVTAQGLTSIVFTFGSGDGSNMITANTGSFSSNTWTGSADKVVFTIGGTSGNRRIAGMKVGYNGQGLQVVTDRYITDCSGTTAIINPTITPARKILRDGQLIIIYQGREYNILGL